MLRKINKAVIISSSISLLFCNITMATSANTKYINAGVFFGDLSFKNGYGNKIFSKSANGIDLTLGMPINSSTFIEAGLSYGFEGNKTSQGTIEIPGGGGGLLPNANLTRISTNLYRANFGLLGKFPIVNNDLNFTLGGGLSYTTFNAELVDNNEPSCLFNKTGMTPYFKAGLEYQITSNSYISIQYNFVMLSALGYIAANYKDNNYIFPQNNLTVQIPAIIKPQSLHLVLISYSIQF